MPKRLNDGTLFLSIGEEGDAKITLFPWRKKFVEGVISISIELIFSQLMIGLSLGVIYVLMASGLSIIFGLLRVVNFAHGRSICLGLIAFFYILTLSGHFWIALILTRLPLGL